MSYVGFMNPNSSSNSPIHSTFCFWQPLHRHGSPSPRSKYNSDGVHQIDRPPGALSTTTTTTTMPNLNNAAVEHPVFFYMPDLSEHPDSEKDILQGLFHLKYNHNSNLHFLQTGSVLQSRGVPFTHALISRFPSVEALRVYYQSAIKDIAQKMRPWLKGEYCVDYHLDVLQQPEDDDDAVSFTSTENMAFYIIFVKVKNDIPDTTITAVKESFVSLKNTLDYVIQLTTGENIYIRESYRTMSHAFSIYLPSSAAVEKLQVDPSFLSVLNDQILPIAESYAIVSFKPFVPQQASTSS